jgi:hypothetical protein
MRKSPGLYLFGHSLPGSTRPPLKGKRTILRDGGERPGGKETHLVDDLLQLPTRVESASTNKRAPLRRPRRVRREGFRQSHGVCLHSCSAVAERRVNGLDQDGAFNRTAPSNGYSRAGNATSL